MEDNDFTEKWGEKGEKRVLTSLFFQDAEKIPIKLPVSPFISAKALEVIDCRLNNS